MNDTSSQPAAHRLVRATDLAWSAIQVRHPSEPWAKRKPAAVQALTEALLAGETATTREALQKALRAGRDLPDVQAFLDGAERALLADYAGAEQHMAQAWGLASGCESAGECTLRFKALLDEPRIEKPTVGGPPTPVVGLEWLGRQPNPARSLAAAVAVNMAADLVLPMLAGACCDGSLPWKQLDLDIHAIVAAVKANPRGVPMHLRDRNGGAAWEAEQHDGDSLDWLPGEMLTLKARASWADKLPTMKLPKRVFVQATRHLGTAAIMLLEAPQAFESNTAVQAVREAVDAWALLNPLCYTDRNACMERFRAKWLPQAEKEIAGIKAADALRKVAHLRLAVSSDPAQPNVFGYAYSWHLPGQSVLRRNTGAVRAGTETSALVHTALTAATRIKAPLTAALLWGHTQSPMPRPAVEAALRKLATREPKLADVRFHEAEPLVTATDAPAVQNVREHAELEREARTALARNRQGILPAEEALA